MGANGCNGLCEKTPTIESFDDQFLPTQTLIPCQVCNVHLDEAKFKEHIDHDHFCCISENHEGIVHAKCLLCQHLSQNLDEQAQHILSKHPFAKTSKKPIDQKAAIITAKDTKNGLALHELYQNKKKRVKKLLYEKDFQILRPQQNNKVEASIQGAKYEGEIETKQYRGAQFEECLAEGELVWFKIFRAEKQYHFFYLDVEPKDRTILCKAYLFMQKK